MGLMLDLAKQDILLGMYNSLDRMTQHIIDGNDTEVEDERAVQVSLRQKFEEISRAETPAAE